MTQHVSIAPAIEAEVVKYLHERTSYLIKSDGYAQGQWLVRVTIQHFLDMDPSISLTLDYVSALMWEQIYAGAMDIDQHGMVTVAASAAV